MTLQNIKLFKGMKVDRIFEVLPNYLKESGYTIEAIENTGVLEDTLLNLAISSQHIKLTQLLVEVYKVDVNKVGQGGITPLMMAVQYGCFNTVNSLLKAGAKVSHKNMRGKCALFFALECIKSQVDVDIIKMLIEQDPNYFFQFTIGSHNQNALEYVASSYEISLEYKKILVSYFISIGVDVTPILNSTSWTLKSSIDFLGTDDIAPLIQDQNYLLPEFYASCKESLIIYNQSVKAVAIGIINSLSQILSLPLSVITYDYAQSDPLLTAFVKEDIKKRPCAILHAIHNRHKLIKEPQQNKTLSMTPSHKN